MNSTDICNLALSYLGHGRIDSLDDSSEEAKACKIHYDHARRRLLLAYPCGFAKRQEKLALRTDTLLGWAYCYSYPQQCLSVQYVYDDKHAKRKETERQEFEVMTLADFAKVIGTDVEEAYAEYILDVKEPNAYNEEFIDALARLLAGVLAVPITGSANLESQNLQLAQQAIASAQYQSAIERERRTQFPRKYAGARFR